MGLDMYALVVTPEAIEDQEVDFKIDSNRFVVKEIQYWRKFNHLHGWMKRLYHDKGGSSSEFNCNPVKLTETDLDKLASDAESKSLYPESGFFFGAMDDFTEDDQEAVLAFVKEAKKYIQEGYVVFYDSWW